MRYAFVRAVHGAALGNENRMSAQRNDVLHCFNMQKICARDAEGAEPAACSACAS